MRYWNALALTGFFLQACATTKPDSPSVAQFRRVHMDHVAPDKKPAYEAARREWLAALAAKNLHEDPGWIVELPGPIFWAIHSFSRWADLDAQKVETQKLDDAVGVAAVTRYGDATHPCLIPPHHNEIWRLQVDLSDPAGLDETKAPVARVEIDEIAPPDGDAWEAAQIELRKALTAARYPLTRITYAASYGSGRYLTFWLAKDRETLANAPSVNDFLGKALGTEAAEKLLAKTRVGVVAHTADDAIIRHDLEK
jgi:hypothetical protein